VSAADSEARSAALDPTRSFIVQAPAGSGKTELLIQRYLALLATVEEPEQVVAITFTRKAAAEMRSRVQRALRDAVAAKVGATEHERATLALARAVVERDEKRDWAVLAQPQRLRIDTLDAFNVWLAQQLPVLSGGVAAARIPDDAREYYRRAAQRTVATVSSAGEPGESLRTVLRGVDDLTELEKLLVALLAKRDQWLPHLVGRDPAELRPELEAALRRLVDDELAPLTPLARPPLFADVRAALRQAAEHATDDRIRNAAAPWLAVDTPPPVAQGSLAEWRAAALLLLTRKGDWRKQLRRNEGFGPAHAAATAKLKKLLERLQNEDSVRAALHAAETLPEPRYTDRQWRHLVALRVVLLHLAAELGVEFASARTIDFVELGSRARRALGRVDEPSELLLALDRRIQHLLVDEFQDTSGSQTELLELLTSGWEPNDGRTLFLVGDPMQSIYRFRDADMSRFLDAKRHGIGQVRLVSLTLERNFRSAPAVVAWVNGAFEQIFPREDQIATGVAAFRASVATRAAGAAQFVATHPVRSVDPVAEAEQVVAILEQELAHRPDQSIAVLVRSRAHLAGLRERIRAKGWPVHAVEIDPLDGQPVAQDLLGLTRALVHLDDRIAWLAVLRAPWCGLRWEDLHALCHDVPGRAIWDLVRDPARAARLTADGRTRLAATRATLESALARRAETSFARWIEQTWHELDGPDCLDHPDDLRVAEQFFALLSREERLGDLGDPARLADTLEKLLPQGDPPRERGIEIMTIHRAKGLEFDTVVLLGIGRDPPPESAQPLHWLERVASNGSEDLLLTPTLDDEDAQALTRFVREADAERTRAERARLLYVATTRARDRLHVVYQLSPSREEPKSDTLLKLLQPVVAAELAATQARDDVRPPSEAQAIEPMLRRLARVAAPSGDAEPAPTTATSATGAQFALPFDAAPPPAPPPRPEFEWASPAAAHVGTVVHRELQRIAEQGIEAWTADSLGEHAEAFTRELLLLGVDADEIAAATARAVAAVRAALEDPQGRWVLGKHAEARSELKLTLRVGERLEHVRLDRTFVADGTRWIIDFKTSRHEGSDREAFLASEVERYRPQLDRYAAALATIDSRPVQVGLYFPLLATLRAWPANA
jgi:ATP-dependent helicase/nuclease subunit A